MAQRRFAFPINSRPDGCAGRAALWAVVVIGLLPAFACGGSNGAPADGGTAGDAALSYTCPPPAPTSCPNPPVRYADIVPAIQRNCISCHSGLTDVWPLTDYMHVADWQDLVRDNVLNCTMPPPDAGVQVTTADRVAILTWILCGFPE